MPSKKQALAAEYVDPNTLVPWEDNPRDNAGAVKDVRASIERFGFAAPIVARKKDNIVIAGHTRLKAALEMGLKSVPVRFLDLSTKQAELLSLADNRLNELAKWDDQGVAHIIQRAIADQDFDAAGLGWDEEELFQIVAEIEGEIEEVSILPPDPGQGGAIMPEADEGEIAMFPTSHVRMVQLFLNADTAPVFLERVALLGEHHIQDNITDTVFHVVQLAAEALEE